MKGKRIWPMVLVALALSAMLTGCGCTANNARPNNSTTSNGTTSSTTNNGTVSNGTSSTPNGSTSHVVDEPDASHPGSTGSVIEDEAIQQDEEFAVDTDTSAARNRRTVNNNTVGNAARNMANDTMDAAENVVNNAANAVKNAANGAGRVMEDVTGTTRTAGRNAH